MMRWIQNTVCFSGLFKSCPACDMADNRQEVMWLLKHVLHRGGDERDIKSEIYSSIYILYIHKYTVQLIYNATMCLCLCFLAISM